jgi:ABC-2 type transport system permease protein
MISCTCNYYGTWSLFKKETLRFLKVYHQTLFSPIVNIMLLLAIFSLAVGNHVQTVQDVPFREFMAAGLIMMAAMQNAFANSSSSFVMGKVMGHIIDYLMPPISAGELLFAMTMGAVARGVLVGLVAFVAIYFFIPLPIHHFGLVLFYLFFATMFLGLLGMLCGVLSETFDHMSAITSYFITPLTFLSGTFYSISALPPFWNKIAHFNPFFYMIDGFRYSITGHNDGNILTGVSIILSVNLILWIVVYHLIKKGYRIKN